MPSLAFTLRQIREALTQPQAQIPRGYQPVEVITKEGQWLLVQADRNGFCYVLDRTNDNFLLGIPFVHSLNRATGFTKEGRPIRVPGREPSLQGAGVCPSSEGATNWMSPAYSPETGYFYFEAVEGCQLQMKAAQTIRPGGFTFNGSGIAESPDVPLQSYIRALELTTGKLRWEYKLIGVKECGAGVLSTAGGLLFSGSPQGTFHRIRREKRQSAMAL